LVIGSQSVVMEAFNVSALVEGFVAQHDPRRQHLGF
jgi:hypothetical protein